MWSSQHIWRILGKVLHASNTKLLPTSGPLHLWFPLRGKPRPLFYKPQQKHHHVCSWPCLQVSARVVPSHENGEITFSLRSSLPNQFKVALYTLTSNSLSQHPGFLSPSIAFFILFFPLWHAIPRLPSSEASSLREGLHLYNTGSQDKGQ